MWHTLQLSMSAKLLYDPFAILGPNVAAAFYEGLIVVSLPVQALLGVYSIAFYLTLVFVAKTPFLSD